MVIRVGWIFFCIALHFSLFAEEKVPTLILEAQIEAKEPLYVGQRAKFIYRVYYNDNIDLIKEDLPLLNAEGFSKIGELKVRTYKQNGWSVNEIIQEVEAKKVGKYTFPPSLIEGRSYTLSFGDKKEYRGETLSSEFPEMGVTVYPFQELKKPASFSGAIGKYHIDVTTENALTFVNDPIRLKVTITQDARDGSTTLNELTLPDIGKACGLSGFFSVNPIPLSFSISGASKTFIIEIRPLSSLIREIPPIEFSFFDESINQYVTVRSNPIQLLIEASPLEQKSEENLVNLTKNTKNPFFELEKGVKLSQKKLEPILDRPAFQIDAKELKEYPEGLKLFEKGTSFYIQALHAESLYERERLLNLSLNVFMTASQRSTPNAKLYANIANILYLLNDEVFASLYYRQALKLDPLDKEIQNFLVETQKKLGVYREDAKSSFDFGSLDALVIYPTLLFQGGSESSEKVREEPLLPGMSVKVMALSEKGEFVKIKLQDGTIGFILLKNLRLI